MQKWPKDHVRNGHLVPFCDINETLLLSSTTHLTHTEHDEAIHSRGLLTNLFKVLERSPLDGISLQTCDPEVNSSIIVNPRATTTEGNFPHSQRSLNSFSMIESSTFQPAFVTRISPTVAYGTNSLVSPSQTIEYTSSSARVLGMQSLCPLTSTVIVEVPMERPKPMTDQEYIAANEQLIKNQVRSNIVIRVYMT